MKFFSLSVISILLFLSLGSCKKIEGPGGSSSIIGNLQRVAYNSDSTIFYQIDLAKEDVFIIYGSDNTVHNDDVETSYNGSFSFDYLEEGNYQVYVYEDCKALDCKPGEKVVLLFDVEIIDKKSIVDLGVILVEK